MEVINKILEEEEIALASTVVHKHLELKYDLGTLLATDENQLQPKGEDINTFLKSLARDNTQLLINKIWTLPKEKCDEVTVAKLPKPTTVLPRALPVPKPREPTKWEKFAKEKGIQKKKKEKVKWDDILQKWVPVHGYKRAEAEKEKDWVLEVPVTSDPFEDQFEKKKSEKSERVAKNEFQRLRNIAKAKNIKIPKVGLTPTAKPSSTHLGAALTIAKASTASLGKFQSKLPKEKEAKGVKDLLPGRKRKDPPLASGDEKKRALSLLDNILNKKPKIIMEQAVEKEVHSINQEENKTKPKNKKGKKSGGKTKTGAKGGKFRGPPPAAKSGPPAVGGRKGSGGARGKKNVRVGGKIKGGRKRR